MMLKFTLIALLIGSALMGFLGLQTGSATTALVGIAVLCFAGFTIFFLAQIAVNFGVDVVKVVLVVALIAVLVFCAVKGVLFLWEQTKTVSQNVQTEIVRQTREMDQAAERAAVPVSLADTQGNLPATPAALSWKHTLAAWYQEIKSALLGWFSAGDSDGQAQTVSAYDTRSITPEKEKQISGLVSDVRAGYLIRIQGSYVKLYGIDAPDPRQQCEDKRGQLYDCGHTAKLKLEKLVLGRHVVCRVTGGDNRGNYVAACKMGDYDIGAGMVAAGWAVADRRLSTVYVPYENAARAEKKGLWVGRFEAPWQARAKKAGAVTEDRFLEGFF